MEAPAYTPRNLAAPIAAWLRKQGFTALEHARPTTATVAAHWLGPQGERFQFDYSWVSGPVPEANCWLDVLYPCDHHSLPLFTAQKVRRLKDVRRLLLGCVRYANARLVAELLPTATS